MKHGTAADRRPVKIAPLEEPTHPRVVAVEVIPPYGLKLTFADRSVGVLDARSWVEAEEGVFAELRDPALFARVRVDREAETIVWPNDADVDPEVLYEEAHRSR